MGGKHNGKTRHEIIDLERMCAKELPFLAIVSKYEGLDCQIRFQPNSRRFRLSFRRELADLYTVPSPVWQIHHLNPTS